MFKRSGASTPEVSDNNQDKMSFASTKTKKTRESSVTYSLKLSNQQNVSAKTIVCNSAAYGTVFRTSLNQTKEAWQKLDTTILSPSALCDANQLHTEPILPTDGEPAEAVRLVALCDGPLLRPVESTTSACFCVALMESGHPIHVLELDSNSGSAPTGYHVLHMTRLYDRDCDRKASFYCPVPEAPKRYEPLLLLLKNFLVHR